MTHYLRVWQPVEIENVKKHLLIVGDLTGDCANCREIGIKYADIKACPQCGESFHFVAVRQTAMATVKRIKERRPDLTFIDYNDYKTITGKQSARDFFK